jgi:hypothetical protein
VADNSIPNLLPVLTGRSYKEFQKECAPNERSQLDDCPFIWKQFSKEGYKTGFAEDATHIPTFYMDWENPFNKPPTDFYMRPFSKFMESNMVLILIIMKLLKDNDILYRCMVKDFAMGRGYHSRSF